MAQFKGTKLVELEKLKLLKTVQPRDKLDGECVKDYEQVYAAEPDVMPPCRTFYDGHRWILSRGFHRVTGARRANIAALNMEVYHGTEEEACLDAMMDNRTHGRRYTRQDKRTIILRLATMPQFDGTSVLKFHEMTGFSRPFITSVIRSMERAQGEDGEDEEEPPPEEEVSFEGEEADEVEDGPYERMLYANKAIDSACREILRSFNRQTEPLADENPWIKDHGRLTTAKQTLSAVLTTLRSCKGHDVCCKCDGSGCKWCRHTGWMDESTFKTSSAIVES